MPSGDGALARVGVLLAWLDDLYRGNPPSGGMQQLAERLLSGGRPTWEECSVAVEEHLADEIASILVVSRTQFPPAQAANAVFGPEFVGSRTVNGADGDLILSGCLYDVKTTINPTRGLAAAMRQLLAYVLLGGRLQLAPSGVLLCAPRRTNVVAAQACH